MRRWSVAMVIVIVLTILLMEHLGLEPDGYRTARARALIEENPETCLLQGRVTEAVYAGEEKCRITLDCGYYGKVLLTVKGECPYEDLPGRLMEAKAELSLPKGASNPGTFDYRNHLRSEGVYLTGECRDFALKAGRLCRNPFRGICLNAVSRFRYQMYNRLKELEVTEEEESAGILTGMLFGSKEHLPDSTYESFRENGTAHILSVSGLHVGVIYAGMAALLGKRRRSRGGTAAVIAGLVLYTFLASFSVSVTRAVWMILLSIAAEKVHRRYDMLSAACVTASFLLMRNPALIHSTGFLLSFSAVVSLAVAGTGLGRLPEPASPAGKALWKVFLPVTAIQAGMAPVNACLFHYFSLAAFLANLPVIFLSGIIIPLGMVTGLLSLLPEAFDVLFVLPARCCGYLAQVMCWFNDLTGLGGRLSWKVPAPSLWMTLGFYLVLWLLLSEHSLLFGVDRRKLKAAGAAVLALFLLTAVQAQLRPDAVFVDVGQGDCIHIHTRDGKDYLVDGGGSVFTDYDVGEKEIVPYLLANGVGRLDGVFISHMDADHYKGLAGVMKEIRVRNVFLYEGYENCLPETMERLELTGEHPPGVVLLTGGERIRLGRDAVMEILAPEEYIPLTYEEEEGFGDAGGGIPAGEGETDLNAACLVMRVDLRGVRMLLTGDIGEEQEARLLGKTRPGQFRCDILKVAHHGSKYSSSEAFVEALRARAAVIQVGEKNRFGHPAFQTLQRLEDAGLQVFRTDKDGAVLLQVRRNAFTLTGFRSGEKLIFETEE